MSAPTAIVFRAEDSSTTVRAARWWKKYRFWLLCAVAFVVLSVLGIILGSGGKSTTGTLSITNPAPAGAQGAASVLRNQGVVVTATASLAETAAALRSNGHGNSTVLFYDPRNLLSRAQAAELAAAVNDSGGKLVALAPGPLTVRELSPELSSVGAIAGTPAATAQCTNPDAVAAGTIDGGAPAPGASATSVTLPLKLFKGSENCFVAPAESPSTGSYLAYDGTGDIAALGNPGIIINQNLASRGNAALTFRLLGSTPNLLWYTASLKDIPVSGQPPVLSDFTPEWIFPASLWLLLVGILGMLWRGRRHGPLVTEPLPVMVKASETLAGRARLYQNARALDTASATLRHATMTRLAHALRLGHAADPHTVVDAVATLTGHTPAHVHDLLLGPAPTTEKDMLSMAVELTALEEEVAQR